MEMFSYLLPLLAAFFMSLATMFIKKSMEEGVGITRISFIINWTFFLSASPTFLLNSPVKDWSLWYWPLMASCTAFLGGFFILLSIKQGAVSVQTSLMGTKAIFVVILAVVFLSKTITTNLWIASFLAFMAILVLGGSDLFKKKIKPSSVFYALFSSFCFALTDILVSKEAQNFGMWPFIQLMFFGVGILSLGYIPFFRKSLAAIKRKTYKWILGTAICMGAQYMLMLYALAAYQNATAINIMYSSRGLWGIILVWFTGHLFGNEERLAGNRVIFRRLVGALMICLAIVIVLSDG